MPPAPALSFPPGFVFGASSSAYQTEGDNIASDLWEWEKKRPWTRSGKASNSFAMWEEDVRCAKALGLRAYRFSVEWGRVLPRPGAPDEAALAHYRRLCDALAAAGIEPIVCLHHFTNPRWVFEETPSLWADERMIERFVEFAEIVAGALPSVRRWLPFNEPVIYASMAHLVGMFPPGRFGIFRSARDFLSGPVLNIARAHRRVYALLKRKNPANEVGVAQNVAATLPLKLPRDASAARLWDEAFHWALLDALVLGRFDADLDGVKETVLGDGPALDFIGINYYTRVFVMRVPGLFRPVSGMPLYSDMCMVPGLGAVYRFLTRGRATLPHDDMLREVYPQGLKRVVLEADRRYGRYGLPIWITEAGCPDERGDLRAPHLSAHLEALSEAVAEGARVRGFLYWSLLDNWEWGSFRPRFGLYRVRFDDSYRREMTEGGALYRDIIARHAGP